MNRKAAEYAKRAKKIFSFLSLRSSRLGGSLVVPRESRVLGDKLTQGDRQGVGLRWAPMSGVYNAFGTAGGRSWYCGEMTSTGTLPARKRTCAAPGALSRASARWYSLPMKLAPTFKANG